jgi:hypothetical protein
LPQAISRVGVRYINRLDIGDVLDDLAPFLKIGFFVTGSALTPGRRRCCCERRDNSARRSKKIAILLDLDTFATNVPRDPNEV